MTHFLIGLVIVFGVMPSIIIGTVLSLGIAITWTVISHLLVGLVLYSLLTLNNTLMKTTAQRIVIETIQTASKMVGK